jgi:hypothetical protein
LQDGESSNLSWLIFRHDVGCTLVGEHLEVLFFRPGANQHPELRPPFQGANLRDIGGGCDSEPHAKRLPRFAIFETVSTGLESLALGDD